MFWAERLTRIAGVALLLMALAIIAGVALEVAATGDADTATRADIEPLLGDIEDNRALFGAAMGFSIAADAVGALALAGLFYLLFRDRSRLLALWGFAGLAGAGIAFMAADSATLTLIFLAGDFADGGPGGIAPGDPAILQSARAVGAFAGTANIIGSTALGFGLVAIGLLFWAPEGNVVPPRWLGGLAVVAGIGLIAAWIGAVEADAGAVVITVGYVGLLIFLIGLGAWLLGQGASEPRMTSASPPTAQAAH